MPQYDFKSPSGQAGDAILQLLAQRKLEDRQKMIDDLNRRNVESQIIDRAAGAKLQQDELTARNKQLDTAHARDIVTMAGADEQVDPETSALLDRTGFGGRKEQRFVPGTPGIGVLAPEELPPDAQVGSEQTMLRPGLAYEQARIASTERKDLAAVNATERAKLDAQRTQDRTDAQTRDQDLRRELQTNQIASAQAIAAAGRQNTADIANANRSVRTDAAAEKQHEKDAFKAAAQQSLSNKAQETVSVIDELLDPKTGKLTPKATAISGGMRVPAMIAGLPGLSGGTAADGHAALARLQGLLDVDLIAEMKSQSKTGATGFGALSEKELTVLESAAAKLKTSQSEKSFAAELKRLREKLSLVSKPAPGATPAASAPTPKSKYAVTIE